MVTLRNHEAFYSLGLCQRSQEAGDFNMDTLQLRQKLAGGIPGSIEILNYIEPIFHNPRHYGVFLWDLQRMNIKGTAIWLAVQDLYDGSLVAFIAAVENRDKNLISFLESQGYSIRVN